MGKLKAVVIDVEHIINECVQDGLDECLGTIEVMKNNTMQNIYHQLELLAEEQGLTLECLNLLFSEEPIEDQVQNALYDVWEV